MAGFYNEKNVAFRLGTADLLKNKTFSVIKCWNVKCELCGNCIKTLEVTALSGVDNIVDDVDCYYTLFSVNFENFENWNVKSKKRPKAGRIMLIENYSAVTYSS